MASPEPVYRKLRGTRSSGVAQTRRLWLGADHLLAVSTAYGFERYRRFYFAEIRAFVIRLTAARLVWNIVLAVLLLLALAGAAAFVADLSASGVDATGKTVAFWICAGLGAVIAVGLILNNLAGPSCELYIQTRAGLELLGGPKRVPKAQRLQAQLAPLIEAAQGRSAPEPEGTPAASTLPAL